MAPEIPTTAGVPDLTALGHLDELLPIIGDLVGEGQVLETQIGNYAARVREVTSFLVDFAGPLPDYRADPLFEWTGYDQLGDVVDNLVSLLKSAIDCSPGPARSTKEATSA